MTVGDLIAQLEGHDREMRLVTHDVGWWFAHAPEVREMHTSPKELVPSPCDLTPDCGGCRLGYPKERVLVL